MALSSDLLAALKEVAGVSDATLSRWASSLSKAYGPMTGDEARWIIAHELGVDLQKHLRAEQIDRVRQLRSQGARWPLGNSSPVPQPLQEKPAERAVSKQNPRESFDARNLHQRVAQSSRKLFVNGDRTEAVRKAFQAVNNRVKELSRTSKNGAELMYATLGGENPLIALNNATTESEQNEQAGAVHLFAGAMQSQRNPRAHDDHWPPDDDPAYSLDCLALASLLHRLLDRVDS